MEDVAIESVMSTELVTVDEDATVARAAGRMLEADVGSVLVVDDGGRLKGLLTATDFVWLVRENDPEDATPVQAAMTTDVATVAPDDTVADLDRLADRGYTHYPVTTDDGTVVGMVSTTDLTAYVAEA